MKLIEKIYPILLSPAKKTFIEIVFFRLAIAFFILDSLLIALVYLGVVPASIYCHRGMPNPLSIIYTPFSILLLYEVYLLIFFLPHSITTYLGKQYEIITLILVRKLFYDIPQLLTPEAYNEKNILHLLVSLGGLIALCGLIFCFYRLAQNREKHSFSYSNAIYERFVARKKALSIVLVLIFFFLFIKSFWELSKLHISTVDDVALGIRQMSNTFFNDFFVVLILIEVLLLLFTFSFSDKFSKVVRNSGFIISTMLLKLSFRAEENTTVFIMLIATVFGVAILWRYRLFGKKIDK
ncbi:MAG: hypothetical protein LBD59_09135 [Prevotellaceae bacterium]|jgi:hypothetical protein|nr:hypothetical protein [Prevotellaceae bacterium]